MGISELRQLDARQLRPAEPVSLLGRDLVRSGVISKSDAALAQMVKKQCDASLDRILTAEGLASEDDLLTAHARRLAAGQMSAGDLEGATLLDADLDPRVLLKHGFVPLEAETGEPVIATANPHILCRLQSHLPEALKGAGLVLAPHHAVQEAVARQHRDRLTEAAQVRVSEAESCRTWGQTFNKRLALTLVLIAALCTLTLAFPTGVFTVFILWASFTLVVSMVMKTASFAASRAAKEDKPLPGGAKEPLPKVSILVPLFRETEIAHALVARLCRLTYPKCLLDVVLVLEEKDDLTRQTLAAIDLPPWIRPVVVPDGTPRTKPRAMNYALDFCEGDIIGIYDAEDAPDPDQITMVARRFQQVPPEVVCLQGVLDYYNPRQNWLARCFTIEYATWFRVMLPGMARLGFAIPLGGTTLFFRREVLEELGGWDAHNVTEDADLGFRLARHGYRTEMIPTVTEEEANCRPWPWIKQRSRWLKGYMTTYLVHMRRPMQLHRQLGNWKFWGFQAHFVSALSQFFLAPVLWSFWLVFLGVPHPLGRVLPHEVLVGFGSLFLVSEVLNIAIHMTAVSGRKHSFLMGWAPTMHFYAPLGTIAAYKALYEIVLKPFYWDKTAHGLSLHGTGQRPSDAAVDLTGIKFQPRHEGL